MARWEREELLAALNLYFQTPFGRQHQTYPPIIEFAKQIGRTPSAVAMKLNNFTSLDPAELARGIKGLSGASTRDREIWEEFSSEHNLLAELSEEILDGLAGNVATDEPLAPAADLSGPSESTAVAKRRRHQAFFRKAVVGSYGYRCCVSGNPVPELLRASHIVPWSVSEEERANPRNGLCLAATYDAAFDRGLIGLDSSFRLIVSDRIIGYLPNGELERSFIALKGKEIAMPEKNLPESTFVQWHRENVFAA